MALLAAAAVSSSVLVGCGGGSSGGTTTLNWYVNPDSSGVTDTVAAACSKQSAGQYRLSVNSLPQTADGQREQIVRRLAAKDKSVDLVNVDPPYTPELANAGWLRVFTEAERAQLLTEERDLEGPADCRAVPGQHPAALVPQVGCPGSGR
jgi:multiple sugar transport system substrate-binding protein